MSKSRTKGKQQRAKRATSNVFAMFDQSQIQEFKEAFNMIDQNHDGFIDAEDLKDMLSSLGRPCPQDYVDEMVKQSPGPINFTMFLTLFGEKLNGTDPEEVIRNAFACFDEGNKGTVDMDVLREMLKTMGERLTDEEIDDIFHDAPIDNEDKLDYGKFTYTIKHGKKD